MAAVLQQEGASTSSSSQPIFGSNLSGGGFGGRQALALSATWPCVQLSTRSFTVLHCAANCIATQQASCICACIFDQRWLCRVACCVQRFLRGMAQKALDHQSLRQLPRRLRRRQLRVQVRAAVAEVVLAHAWRQQEAVPADCSRKLFASKLTCSEGLAM